MDFFPLEIQQHMDLFFLGATTLLIICLFLLLLLYLRLRDIRTGAEKKSQRISIFQHENAALQEEITQQKVRSAKLITLLKNERKNTNEKLTILDEAKEKLNLQFQTLAEKIFEEKNQKFGHENKEKVSALLQPLQEQLRSFQQRIDDIQVNDIRERSSLKEEIVHLRELNQKINKEATNLTRALRGDKKIQGNWGELVLERVLEKSGLRKGEEYSVQLGFRNSDHQLLKPDVVIHLPDNRDIIIDSKVSLLAWERYVNCDNEEEKKHILTEHIQNLRNHVKSLSSKNYSNIPEINTLDFVLLFLPIDSSYVAAYEADEKLFGDAYEQKIIIVTPTTMLATLKTIENLWRYELQNRNSQEIADRAGAIYDKLRGFLEEMEKIGKQLATCNTTYESALNKLVKGRGNILSQADKLTELGVKAKKKIPSSIKALSDQEIPN